MTVTCKLGESGCWNDGKCRATSNCENKIVTNADRIRAMTDEELRVFLCSNTQCEVCGFEGWGGCELSKWLQQPAEGDA